MPSTQEPPRLLTAVPTPAHPQPTRRAILGYLQSFCSPQPDLLTVKILAASPKLLPPLFPLLTWFCFCLFALVLCLNFEHNPTPPERGGKDFLVYLQWDVWEGACN